jgi:hypothetical protein
LTRCLRCSMLAVCWRFRFRMPGNAHQRGHPEVCGGTCVPACVVGLDERRRLGAIPLL